MDPAGRRRATSASAPSARPRSGGPAATSRGAPRASARSAARRSTSTRGCTPGMLVGGQYEVVGCLAHGGMGWIYLARDRNVNGRWVVLKGLLNTGDPDASRAAVGREAVPRRGRAPADRRDLQLRHRARRRVLHRHGVRRRHVAQQPPQAAHGRRPAGPTRRCRSIRRSPTWSRSCRRSRYLHTAGLLYCDFKPANMIQVGDSVKLIDLGGVRRIDDDVVADLRHRRLPGPRGAARRHARSPSDIYTVGRTLGRAGLRVQGLHERVRRPRCRRPSRCRCSPSTTRCTGCC